MSSSFRPPKAVVIVLLLAVAGGGMAWWSQRDASRAAGPRLYGNVDVREVEMAFRQPGRLVSVKVDEGAAVKAGDLLAELDAQPLRDALAAAQAEVQRAQAELDKLRRGNRPQEVKRAEAGVAQIEATLRRAEADLRRQSELASSGAASQRTLEAARAARDEAAAALASAQQAASLQKEGFRTEDVAAAQARLAAALAQRAVAQTALDDTRLVAPAAAVVQSRVREPGSMVGARDAVLTLSLRDPVYVRAYVAEAELGRVTPGTQVSLRTDSSPKTFHGQVGFISPRAEFTPKSVETTDLRTDLVYRLRIVVVDADDSLRQGMPVTVSLDTGAR